MGVWGTTPWGEELWGGPPTATATIAVSIGGVDVTEYLVPASANITRSKRGRSTASFELIDVTASYKPQIGQPVVITDGGTTFHGLVARPRFYRKDLTQLYGIQVECEDYAAIFNRRFVSRRYPANSLASEVIMDIFTSILADDGFDADNVEGFALITDELVFDHRSVTDAFNQVSDLTGEDWWLGGSAGKSLYFRSLLSSPAALFSITDDSENWRNLTVDFDSSNYRNRQYVRAGKPLTTGAITDTFTGNGTQYFFTTRFPLVAAPTVTLDSAPQAVYEHGVDTPGQAGWYWFRNGGGVIHGQQIAPANGASLVVEYGSFASSVVMAEDAAEQAARAAIEGGSGIWEAIEDARDIDALDVALAYAQGVLDRHKEMPVTVSYETDTASLDPGMAQEITLTPEGIDGIFYVTQINSRAIEVPFRDTGHYFRHRVTLTSIRDQGDDLNWWRKQLSRGAASAVDTSEPSTTITADYTVDGSYTLIHCDTTLGNVVVTLQKSAMLAGKTITIDKISADANTVTVTPATGETVHYDTSLTLADQGDVVQIKPVI
jgi:hypothetical protein